MAKKPKKKSDSYNLKRCTLIRYNFLFGSVELSSPYLWKVNSHLHVASSLGLKHLGRSQSTERALTDFGIEKSFQRAAAQFEEHYGWSISRTTVARTTESIAERGLKYVEKRLTNASQDFNMKGEANEIITELDGCEIRTGLFKKVVDPETGEEKVTREESWREVRVGFARQLNGLEKTYVAKMAKYPEIVNLLLGAAVLQGYSGASKILGIADGGQGLKEELEGQFADLQFILDKPHLKQHLGEGAESLGLEGEDKRNWVNSTIEQLSRGDVSRVIESFDAGRGNTVNRIRQLAGYITRFANCIHYEHYKEQGWPIGSGEVESSHRYIPQERLKIAGACWHPNTINPMLALRVIRANGWWADFWESGVAYGSAA